MIFDDTRTTHDMHRLLNSSPLQSKHIYPCNDIRLRRSGSHHRIDSFRTYNLDYDILTFFIPFKKYPLQGIFQITPPLIVRQDSF